MPYVKTTWVSGSTPTDAAELNNLENGVSGAYTELESITGNDGVVQATTDGPFTLANFVNFILKALRSITGSTNWYDVPAATIASLNTGKADLSGATFTGAVSGTTATFSSHLTATDATLNASNAAVELGAKASANTPFVDFNSSGNSNDYDARIIASGGSGSNGAGTLNIQSSALQHNSNTVWDAGNDGTGSGLDADKLDGIDSLGFVRATAGLTGKFSAQSTAPTSPADGDLWLDTSIVLS